MNEIRLRDGSVEWREVEGEIVALETETSTYLAANQAGAVLWQALAGGASRERLVQVLCDRFEVDAETAARDVDRFLVELSARGLLEE